MLDKTKIFIYIYFLTTFWLTTPFKKNQIGFRTIELKDHIYNTEVFYIRNSGVIEIEMDLHGRWHRSYGSGILEINGHQYQF